MKKILVLLVMALCTNTWAYKTATPIQYSGLQWTVSGTTGMESVATCTSMTLNGVTDFADNSLVSLVGTLNCNTGAFVVIGAGYINVSSGLSMGLYIAPGYFWNCATDASLNANCKVLAPASGNVVGYPVIAFN